MNKMTDDKTLNKQTDVESAFDDETLLFYFYGDLSSEDRLKVEKALKGSQELNSHYQMLTSFLDEKVDYEIPSPGDSFEQNIMAAIHRESEQVEKEKSRAIQSNNEETTYLNFWRRLTPVFAGSLTLALVVSVFLFGRWSVGPEEVKLVAETNRPNNEGAYFSEASTARLLNTRLVEHLEAGDRLFTLVSNGNGDLQEQIKARQQMIEELVVFNRIYRRLADQKGDKQLAELLSQMERVLIELENGAFDSSGSGDYQTMNSIKQRVENSDLLFKLKVTNKKYQKNII